MTGSTPWLSVVMPVFNGAETLRDSLASLCDQGDGIEVVLVDQCSTDGSVALAQEFADQLNLRIFEKPAHTNWMQNTNYAITRATAPLITMLHQDDVWFRGRGRLLRQMYDGARDATLWVHAARYLDLAGRSLGQLGPAFGEARRLVATDEATTRLIVQNTIALPAAMFPRALVLQTGGLDDELWYTADWDLWLRLASSGPVAWSPETAVGFRLHAGSQTMTASGDTQDFHRQLAIPLERHGAALRRGVLKRAEASNSVNAWLAAAYHGDRPALWPVLRRLFSLGPIGFARYLQDSRILRRVMPRLRTLLRARTPG